MSLARGHQHKCHLHNTCYFNSCPSQQYHANCLENFWPSEAWLKQKKLTRRLNSSPSFILPAEEGCPDFAGRDDCFCELAEPYEAGSLVEAAAVSLLVVTDFFFCLKLKSALPSYSTA